jgi:hypothetical protein
VIEDFQPASPIKNGVRLITDNRGESDQESALFNLAATERKYFQFLKLESEAWGPRLCVSVQSDQKRTGIPGIMDQAKLEFVKRYFATIAVHAKGANSRRINLVIDAISETEVRVAESLTSIEDVRSLV